MFFLALNNYIWFFSENESIFCFINIDTTPVHDFENVRLI